MKSQEIIHIAVAETSMIVRSGLVAVLKRLPDLNVQTVEITCERGVCSIAWKLISQRF